MLVVQNDRDNQRLANTVVAQVTSNTSRSHEPTHLLIEIGTAEVKRTGLLSDSLVSCVNLATIGKDQLGKTIGRLPPPLTAKVGDCLTVALGLPQTAKAGQIGSFK